KSGVISAGNFRGCQLLTERVERLLRLNDRFGSASSPARASAREVRFRRSAEAPVCVRELPVLPRSGHPAWRQGMPSWGSNRSFTAKVPNDERTPRESHAARALPVVCRCWTAISIAAPASERRQGRSDRDKAL